MIAKPGKLAICALAKDEALYIEEWLAFHFLQGASEILIFDNESTDNMRDILARVARHGDHREGQVGRMLDVRTIAEHPSCAMCRWHFTAAQNTVRATPDRSLKFPPMDA
jgi:hypothetical protein